MNIFFHEHNNIFGNRDKHGKSAGLFCPNKKLQPLGYSYTSAQAAQHFR